MVRAKVPRLSNVLAYRNTDVVIRFQTTWDVSRADADRIFKDLMRFFWVAAQAPVSPVPIVDEMWHTFLLYTIAYHKFSVRYFGCQMIEHIPRTIREQRAMVRQRRANPKLAHKRYQERITQDASIVFDHLGETVARRWYLDYADRFGPRFFTRR